MDSAWTGRLIRRFLAAMLVTGFFLTLTTSASAYIYWSNAQDPPFSIGRANLDGSGADHEFVPAARTSCDVAVDDTNVYWTSGEGLTSFVGRANLVSRVAQNHFIEAANDLACGVAVDDSHVYFNNFALGAIGRANLNGSSIDQTFITGGINPQHPTVHDGKIYWTNKSYGCPPGCTVGVANDTGLDVNQDFITGTYDPPSGVAVDDSHVYWGNGDSIGRSDLTGEMVDPDFITTDGFVCDVAVDSGHVYWARWLISGGGGHGAIGRAKLDGSSVDNQFVVTKGQTCGVTVDSARPSSGFTFTVVPRITCAGICRVVLVQIKFDSKGIVVAEQILPGQDTPRASASGKGHAGKHQVKLLVKQLKTKVKAGRNHLKLKLTAAGRKKLRRTGNLKLRMRFRFKPTGGKSSSKVRVVKIRSRRR